MWNGSSSQISKNSTYFARLILQQQNELHTERKIVELDARPSDCLALAAAQKKPVFVSAKLFEQLEDMSQVLDKINESGEDADVRWAHPNQLHFLLICGDDDFAVKQRAETNLPAMLNGTGRDGP